MTSQLTLQEPRRGPVAIKNVAGFMALTMRLVERDPDEPGFGVCHGFSGYGKTRSSLFAQNKTNATRVEVRDSWSRRTLLDAILSELGKKKASKRETILDLAARTIDALGDDPRRPLIIDEADRLVDKRITGIVLELQECSGVPVILIGEETLPEKLLTIERMHNRVLDWFPAQPCDLDDTRALAKAFAPGLKLGDDLLDMIRVRSAGRARRIVTNIGTAREIARNKSLSTLDLGAWGDHRWHTGEPPQTRSTDLYTRQARAS